MIHHAKVDESYLHSQLTTPFYVVAGYVGPSEHWEEFSDLWGESLAELNAEDVGYHASDCHRGKGEFRDWSEDERKELGYRLVVDITAAKLIPCVAAVDMQAYRRHQGALSAFLDRPEYKKYNHPHILAAHQFVQQTLMITEADSGLVSFVFDQNQEFGKRVIEWFAAPKSFPELFVSRLGSMTQDERRCDLGLQAADLLAYSALRELCGDPAWHWKTLNDAVPAQMLVTGEAEWQHVTAGLPSGK